MHSVDISEEVEKAKERRQEKEHEGPSSWPRKSKKEQSESLASSKQRAGQVSSHCWEGSGWKSLDGDLATGLRPEWESQGGGRGTSERSAGRNPGGRRRWSEVGRRGRGGTGLAVF